MSGLYKTLIIVFGLSSVLLVMFFMNRMNEKDGYKVEINLKIIETFKYAVWLIFEVAKCNLAVVKLLLARKVKIAQQFVEIPVSIKSDLAQVIFANSITLTPGTVTVETEDKLLLVHVLNLEDTTRSELINMCDKVTRIEK
jgi:multicomponent Na+:H+ antiporter subunit E